MPQSMITVLFVSAHNIHCCNINKITPSQHQQLIHKFHENFELHDFECDSQMYTYAIPD